MKLDDDLIHLMATEVMSQFLHRLLRRSPDARAPVARELCDWTRKEVHTSWAELDAQRMLAIARRIESVGAWLDVEAALHGIAYCEPTPLTHAYLDAAANHAHRAVLRAATVIRRPA